MNSAFVVWLKVKLSLWIFGWPRESVYRDYLKFERFRELGDIVVIGIDGGLALSPSDRDYLPVELELSTGYIRTGA